VVHPSVPVKSVAELVAYAKANPGKVNFSSGGIGVLPHLIGEWFKSRAGIDIVHVPYRGGGPSINDLVGGQVQMTFEGTSVLLPLIESGKLRALAVTSAKRLPQLPEVPTMTESGFPGFVSTSWTGLLAPAHTPRAVIDKLNAQINEGLKTPELKAALARVSNEPVGGTPQDFANMIKGDIDKWAPVVKALGLPPQ
jgi:tripartite-type tricarboxylate transporter receptor subunit TctC